MYLSPAPGKSCSKQMSNSARGFLGVSATINNAMTATRKPTATMLPAIASDFLILDPARCRRAESVSRTLAVSTSLAIGADSPATPTVVGVVRHILAFAPWIPILGNKCGTAGTCCPITMA